MRQLAFLPFVLWASSLLAAPETYHLQPDVSSVGFETDFGPDRITGTMPVKSADLVLDFAQARASKVTVTLDAASAEASFPFAAQAMKGSKVLDTADFPEISFVSTRVDPAGQGAIVTGNITIRGVTQQISLKAEIYRPPGTAEGDHRHLTVRLTGAVLRSQFGATGWSDMVGDEVRLNILARIERVG